MSTINVKTKFDVGDSVFGFVDGEIHNLIIDRIEISVERYYFDKPIQNNKIVYLATTTDAKFNHQHRFHDESLYTENELKELVKNYFESKTY